jgi:hypothetical protein
MKSCSSCGHECHNGAGYCPKCLDRFSGAEPKTPEAPQERFAPYLASGFVLFFSIFVMASALFLLLHSRWWDILAQLLAKALH